MLANKSFKKNLVTTLILGTIIASTAIAKSDRYNYKGAMKSIPHTTITFNAGSAVLSDSVKASIRSFVSDARELESIAGITIAAWSDRAVACRVTDSRIRPHQPKRSLSSKKLGSGFR